MRKILLFLTLSVLIGCSPSSTGVLPVYHDVCCQAYKVVAGDTSRLGDLATYNNTDQTPAQLEAWYGIKGYGSGTGYSYYDCWLK